MAGRQDSSNLAGYGNIQSLVQNIVADIVSDNREALPRESGNPHSSNYSCSSSGVNNNDVTQELHTRFGVPRQNYGRSATARRRSRQTYLTNVRLNNERPQQAVCNSDFFIKNVILLPAPTYSRVLYYYLVTILYRFEFVKSAGTKLTSINLPPGQRLSARILKHVSGNGPVYVRALEELCDEVSILEGNYRLPHSELTINCNNCYKILKALKV